MRRTYRAIAILALSTAACHTAPSPDVREPEPRINEAKPTRDRPSLTRAECVAAGGTVVGDIGDGAIHRPDYRCATTGDEPLGTIKPAPGEPIAFEGAVCCPKG